jgi:hypothetical protein
MMQKKFNVLMMMIMMIVFMLVLPFKVLANTAVDPFVTDLIAGQYTDVGDVLVWNDEENLYVKYLISEPNLCLDETHLQVATSLAGIPQTKNGNPIPGQFAYQNDHDLCIDEYTYSIPLNNWEPGTSLYLAAHAVVGGIEGLDDFEAVLPEIVTVNNLNFPPSPPTSYVGVILSGGTILDGTYNGWCLDVEQWFAEPPYQAQVYSSYETLPSALLDAIDHTENLDLVNWIVNQNYVGQTSPGGFGEYTSDDVQCAIWRLLDDPPLLAPDGSLRCESQSDRVDEILAAAYANGEGFVPGCNEYLLVLLAPTFSWCSDYCKQIIGIPVPIPCEDFDETAWGSGTDFPGKNWATYFNYTIE